MLKELKDRPVAMQLFARTITLNGEEVGERIKSVFTQRGSWYLQWKNNKTIRVELLNPDVVIDVDMELHFQRA